MKDKPNFLVLQNDHQAYYRHSWNAVTKLKAPNFDCLASGGVLFERSYTAAPLCGPARRTILTGQYPNNHKLFYYFSEALYNHELYFQNLGEIGFRNYYFCKWHVGMGTVLYHMCEGICPQDYGNPYVILEYKRYLHRQGSPYATYYVKRMFTADFITQQYPNLKENKLYKCYEFCFGKHAIGVTTSPKETQESFFGANLTREKLDELAHNKGAKPFSMRVDFWSPQKPHFSSVEFIALDQPSDILEYENFGDSIVNKPKINQKEHNRPRGGDDGKIIMPIAFQWSEWKDILLHVYVHISLIDAEGYDLG